ncbi:MAG: hypothetical protein K2O14_15035 [Oscillospiraceae bacterium]|nr:hypothetical protein [Oscillospiraceae bacterium]
MTDIIPLLRDIPHNELTRRESFQSRFGWHGYYVFGEGSDCDGINIYFDRNFDYIKGQPRHILDLDPKYLIALVSVKLSVAFVLKNFFEQFRRDTSGMGLAYVPVGSFDEKSFFCSDVGKLPENFSAIRWIDDGFLYDGNKEFDFDLFYEIDGGTKFLNPNHFSLLEIFDYIQ